MRQRPDSHMAQEWCVNYGVLPYDEAADVYEQVLQRKKKGKASGMLASPPRQAPKKKKKIIKDEPVDPVMSSVVAERIMSADL